MPVSTPPPPEPDVDPLDVTALTYAVPALVYISIPLAYSVLPLVKSTVVIGTEVQPAMLPELTVGSSGGSEPVDGVLKNTLLPVSTANESMPPKEPTALAVPPGAGRVTDCQFVPVSYHRLPLMIATILP